MTELQEMIFISEIALQPKIAQRVAEHLQGTHSNFDRVETWYSILVAARNLQ